MLELLELLKSCTKPSIHDTYFSIPQGVIYCSNMWNVVICTYVVVFVCHPPISSVQMLCHQSNNLTLFIKTHLFTITGIRNLTFWILKKTAEFPAQRTSNAENVSIWWRHHETFACCNRVFQNSKIFELHCGLLLTYDACQKGDQTYTDFAENWHMSFFWHAS